MAVVGTVVIGAVTAATASLPIHPLAGPAREGGQSLGRIGVDLELHPGGRGGYDGFREVMSALPRGGDQKCTHALAEHLDIIRNPRPAPDGGREPCGRRITAAGCGGAERHKGELTTGPVGARLLTLNELEHDLAAHRGDIAASPCAPRSGAGPALWTNCLKHLFPLFPLLNSRHSSVAIRGA